MHSTMASKTWTMAVVIGLGAGMTASSARAEEPETADDHPRGTYVRVDAPQGLSGGAQVQHGGAPHILFLQRCAGGLTISPGNGGSIANESQIVGGVINFPPFPYGDAAWNEVVDRTRDLFAPFNIMVTDVDPGNTPHDEAIVCGDGAAAGFAGAGGVAPFSCGVIDNAITFTFAQTLGNNPELLANVVGQEAAHAWGLDHQLTCNDPMTYLPDCGPKAFQDLDAQCGEYNVRACSCGGATQNSYQHIMGIFGPSMPDTQSPTAAITYPSDGQVFAPGAEFEITVSVSDDVEVANVTLFVDGSPEGSDASAPFGPWPVSNIPEGTYEFYIEATDVAGNVTASPVVTVDVTPDGEPPPPPASDDGGAESGGADDGAGSSGGDDGLGDDGLGDDAGLDGGSDPAADGALPPGYGTGFDPTNNDSCNCSTDASPRGGVGFGVLLLGLLGLRTQGRRRRAR